MYDVLVTHAEYCVDRNGFLRGFTTECIAKKDSEQHLLGLFLGDDAGTRSRLRVPVVRFAEMLTPKCALLIILEKKDYICGRKSDK